MVAKKLVEVAEVEVEFPVIVRFPFTVDEALEMKPAEKVESPAVESVPPTERLVGEKLVAERFVVKKFVEVAEVVVASNPVKFCKVDEADERKPEARVTNPAVLIVNLGVSVVSPSLSVPMTNEP